MNGQEGLDAFKDHEIDLVLMDLQNASYGWL
jgi:CheY-like chemotaxis protein